MSIRKKILAISIGPVLVLGVITLLFMLTMVKSSLMDEVQDALKGTAAATLAAYDQNTGDYLESTNGDIWKGSYNISKVGESGGPDQREYRYGCNLFLWKQKDYDICAG